VARERDWRGERRREGMVERRVTAAVMASKGEQQRMLGGREGWSWGLWS
jgi:hypothetical protein